MRALRASPVFFFVVFVTLGLFGLIGVVLLQPDLVGGLLGQNMVAHISRHFREPHHRIHDLTFSFIVGTAAVGMLAQLRPLQNVASQLMALIPWVMLVLTFTLTNRWVFAPAPIFGALTLIATILHPRRRDLFKPVSFAWADRMMLALIISAAVPLLAFAVNNIGLQRTLTNDHAALGHYGFMACFGFTLVAVGLLASLRLHGWPVTAWVCGGLGIFFGLASFVFPDVDSRLSPAWAVAAIAWGGTFVAVAELVRARDRARHEPAAVTGAKPTDGSSTARWAYVLAIVVVLLSVLLVIHHVDSGVLTRHAQ